MYRSMMRVSVIHVRLVLGLNCLRCTQMIQLSATSVSDVKVSQLLSLGVTSRGMS